jgi:hypothetical protein
LIQTKQENQPEFHFLHLQFGNPAFCDNTNGGKVLVQVGSPAHPLLLTSHRFPFGSTKKTKNLRGQRKKTKFNNKRFFWFEWVYDDVTLLSRGFVTLAKRRDMKKECVHVCVGNLVWHIALGHQQIT